MKRKRNTVTANLVKGFSFIIIALIFPDKGFAQNVSVQNGIMMRTSSVNNNTFYYGEPVTLFFEFANTNNAVNPFHRPETNVNLTFDLKNLATGKVMPKAHSGFVEDYRASMQKPPKDPYLPNEYGYYILQASYFFGSEKLSTEKINGYNDLVDRLRAIPVGDYELMLQYELLPGNKLLNVTHRFKVLPVPGDEEAVLQHYVKSTIYACKGHFYTGKNYSSRHPDSYENFIKKYPKSIFANHAFLNMVVGIYHYAGAGPTDQERFNKLNDFINYYPTLRNNGLKMFYVAYLPKVYKTLPNRDAKKELDSFLQKIKDDNAEISRMLVREADYNNGITGLKSYAQGDIR